MALLRPLDKLPTLDVATILLVGAEEKLLERLGEAILREGEGTAKVQVHVAPGLPLPADRECFRPRVDLVVFVLSLHSKHSLRTVEASLPQLDAGFFLGKVCFLANGAGKEQNASIHMDAVAKMATAFCSPLLFGELEVESSCASVARRLLHILKICAGHVPGLSALNLLSMMKRSLEPALPDV
ncbi:centromere protein M isoform X2 [Gracilinanus agilis]|uniref:centromere protein M isoform X2 n=1 Tax=Gracilinanus agilis TaxID=191870 RepID=UPI001CFF3F60|nr:centromere protein M isoform X2 [Gracilinanus agilis]